jgi:nucleoside-diphosphate-sugar epimerase
MRKPAILITGASGEVGHGLVQRLAGRAGPLITLDVVPLPGELAPLVQREVVGSVLDTALLERLLAEYEIDAVYHLAALLSTRAEFSPLTAHQVNVGGTLQLLEFAQQEAESHGRSVVFVYPSSIAVYGLPDSTTREQAGPVQEDQWTVPATMYGCNKLYCEHLGRYYTRHYKQLSARRPGARVDFRAVRFPGLISAATVPSGGTSDYAAEMIHAAAREQAYACFVRPETRLPFMAMPDAVDALVALSRAPADRLTRTAYNVGSFAVTAEEVRAALLEAFPSANLSYRVDERRQGIVDSWPAALDDRAARRDWNFAPRFDFAATLSEYVLPALGTSPSQTP